jgi:hypothetical protein
VLLTSSKCTAHPAAGGTPLFRLSRHSFSSDGGSVRALSLNGICIFEIAFKGLIRSDLTVYLYNKLMPAVIF